MLAQQGYGLWYDTAGVAVPPYFNSLHALRIIGYNIKDTTAAIQSFKLHFIQHDITPVLNKEDKKVLFDLAKKYE
jgi:N-acetylmuramoyl-L-alanine amidase